MQGVFMMKEKKFNAGWTPVPLVSQAQLDMGHTGGEGCQWLLYAEYDSTDGQLAFIGTDVGGMYRSQDGGKNWSPCTVGINSSAATGISIDPNNKNRVIAVGCNSCSNPRNGLYLSTDAGDSWRPVCLHGIVGHRDLRHQIAFDKSSYDEKLGGSAVIYWSREVKEYRHTKPIADPPALFKSTDGGETWSLINDDSRISGAVIFCHPVKGWLYAAGQSGLFRSKDGGVSFEQIFDGNILALDVILTRPDNVYLSKNDGIYVSTDSGDSFEKVSVTGYPQENPMFLRVSPVNPDNMVVQENVLGKTGKYENFSCYSHDGGKTWHRVTLDCSDSFIPYNCRQNPYCWHPTDENICLTTGGDFIMRSTDGAKTFKMSTDGYNGACITYIGINVNDPKLICLSNQDYNGAYSTDTGRTWNYLDWYEPWGGMTYGAYPVDEKTYVTVLRDDGGKFGLGKGAFVVCRTEDGGKTCYSTGAVSHKSSCTAAGVVGNENIVILNELRSEDKGKTWAPMEGCDSVKTYDPVSGDLYGVSGGHPVRSTDGGVSWSEFGNTDETIRSMCYDGVGRRLWMISSDGVRVYRADESGCAELIDTLPDTDGFETPFYSHVAVDTVDPDIVYVSSRKNTYQSPIGLLRSLDGGKTWQNLTRNPGDGSEGVCGGKEVNYIRVNPLTRELFASGGCRGLWKLPSPEKIGKI
jgi:photosystem II stability/assembly factor-like uncharacterized protein